MMRFLFLTSIPVLLLSVLLLFTILQSWATGQSLCTTWMAVALPYCGY